MASASWSIEPDFDRSEMQGVHCLRHPAPFLVSQMSGDMVGLLYAPDLADQANGQFVNFQRNDQDQEFFLCRTLLSDVHGQR